MKIYVNPAPDKRAALMERNIPDEFNVDTVVRDIIADVKARGDEAIRDMALRFDKVELADLEVSQQEIAKACEKVSPKVKAAIATAKANIHHFHEAQRRAPLEVVTAPGVKCSQRAVPIQRVGLYIPGGNAPLFSTVLMLAIPASIAGCREVVLCTPQRKDEEIAPEILYAAKVCGVHRIFRIGGAQAIAAMALGTQTVPRVYKIFGPGNRFVTKAKQMLSNKVAIDMPAGPSEVLVLADATAKPSFVAADLLSQAEHGPDSQAILVTDSESFASDVMAEVGHLSRQLSRRDDIERSLGKSRIIVIDNLEERVAFVNEYAPEHLIIATKNPHDIAAMIVNAGSVFLGNYSPESAGDYASGTNHTLPTGAWARSHSGVNLDSFMRRMTLQELTPAGLANLGPTIVTMAEAEGLDAHALAVKIRLEP